MMTTTSKAVVIPLDPVAASRPRVRVIRLKDGRQFNQTYYAGRYKQWMADAERLVPVCQYAMVGPLRCEVEVIVQKARTSKLDHPTPDVDNYAKAALDVLTKKGYWDDDKQVIHLVVSKRFAEADEQPRTEIVIDYAHSLSL